MKKRYIIAGVAAGAAAIACAAIGIRSYLQEKNAGSGYEEVREEVKDNTPEEPEPEETGPAVEIPIDFEALQARNPDVYAWITVPGTQIDYPILQNPDDNSYYLTHTIDGEEKIEGAIFTENYNANAKDIFFIGRGIDYAISMEGSLKMKEISYIHSEAYAAGELKHGTISLIEDGTLVVGVATWKDLFEKTISNMVEVKSRGAYLMGLTLYGNYSIEDTADFSVYVPKTEKYFTTSLAIIPLQLMGYYVSVAKGLDVDKPRNLAKSVTVE